ncbi:MAG: ABC transporter permease [Tessaracoccus sp.]|uniref:ABC transporter permease n=1 Tax=Tessaracoccus sp. TaxID=1971211 RepID=UPI001EB8F0E8|nr:FtsX-like permease family protein [Tessaracoccus sp.]MBK7822157.1 ABC transporter permease [Tessaracoccus sp.]
MLRATWKSLWARKIRLSLSALAIVLGVAFVAGSLMFTAMLRDGLDSLLKGSFGDVNVIAEGAGIEALATPRLLTQADADAIAAVPGVARATGIVSSYSVFPLAADGSLLAFPGTPGVATNWHDTPAAGGQTGPRIVDGRAPAADDEVVIDPATVARGGHAIGDDVRVATPLDGIRSYRLVGTGTYGAGATAGSSYLFFTLDEARAIAAKGADGYTGMWLQVADGASVDGVAAAVDDVLPDGFEATTAERLADNTAERLDVGLGFVNILLLVFAGIALIVASLLILNTFSILIAQRARELALLRAVGATRRQVLTSVLLEALVIGVIGATIGLVVGYGLAWSILGGMRAFGLDLGPVTPQISWQATAAGYAVGVVITLLAALSPARRASSTRPVEALAAVDKGPERQGATQYVGIGLMELGAAGVVCAVLLPIDAPFVWLGAGAVLLLVGAVLATAAVGRPLVWACGRVFRRVFGEVGRLAELNSVRQPRRTAATAATLMIGVALVTTVAIVAASTTASVERRLTSDQRGDFVIAPVGYEPFDARIVASVQQIDGVSAAYPFFRGPARIGDADIQLGGASAEALERGSSLRVTAGSLHADGDALPALVSSDLARDQGLAIGRIVDISGPVGEIQVLITGIQGGGSTPSLGDVVVTPETFAEVTDASRIHSLTVFLADGADREAVRAALKDVVADIPTAAVSDVAEFAQARVDQFGQLFGAIYALLALAIVISVLGIVNTLGLSVMERAREVGLLRAVGLTRPQLRRMVTLEAVIVALLGAALGVLLGLALGLALASLLDETGVDVVSVPWALLGLFVVGAALAGVIAAVGPAGRAARASVIDSIAVE